MSSHREHVGSFTEKNMLYILNFLLYVCRYEKLLVIQTIHRIVEVTPMRAVAVFIIHLFLLILFIYLIYL